MMLVPTETEDTEDVVIDSNGSNRKDSNEYMRSESDAAILRSINSLQDHVFSERFMFPLQKVRLFSGRKIIIYISLEVTVLIFFAL